MADRRGTRSARARGSFNSPSSVGRPPNRSTCLQSALASSRTQDRRLAGATRHDGNGLSDVPYAVPASARRRGIRAVRDRKTALCAKHPAPAGSAPSSEGATAQPYSRRAAGAGQRRQPRQCTQAAASASGGGRQRRSGGPADQLIQRPVSGSKDGSAALDRRSGGVAACGVSALAGSDSRFRLTPSGCLDNDPSARSGRSPDTDRTGGVTY
jgi:hypothetical protein